MIRLAPLSRRGFHRLLRVAFATIALASTSLTGVTGAGAADLSTVTLRVGDQTGATRARLEAAGLLKDVPYKIEWSVYAAAVNLHEALKADAVDIGGAADSPTVSAIAGGSKIKVVANYSNGGLGTALLVPAGSPITSLADLKGKTISPTTRGSVAHFLTLAALRQAGLSANDVKLAFLTPVDANAAFQAGSIDAWATWNVYQARAIGTLKARVLVDGTGLITGNLLYSATDTAINDPGKRAAIADFADRVDRSYQWAQQNKQAFLDFYVGFAKQDRTIAEQLYPAESSYQRTALDDRFVASFQQVFTQWKEAGVLSGDLKLADYVYRDLPLN